MRSILRNASKSPASNTAYLLIAEAMICRENAFFSAGDVPPVIKMAINEPFVSVTYICTVGMRSNKQHFL